MGTPNPKVYIGEEVAAVRRLHQDLLTDDARQLAIAQYLDRQAERILQGHRSRDPAVATHITCWHPELIGQSADTILRRDFTLTDARETIAREYGFDDWSDAKRRGSSPTDPGFETAVEALLAGDVGTLRALLENRPSLIRERSRFGHQSTLLHYVGSNGVETHRQVVPHNLAEVTRVLLDAGADVNATAEMYGGDSTTLALLVTSSHPTEAGVVDDVVKVLLEAGARTDHP